MKQRDRDMLDHIIRYCDRISGYINGLSDGWNSFESDQMCQDACCMCIAQIGELSGHLTDEFKKAHPDIPWREIKDTRNLYANNYGGII